MRREEHQQQTCASLFRQNDVKSPPLHNSCTISFENIVYTIPKPFLAPSRPSPSGVKGRRKTILRGMSGICRAGELTAILGPTGGGKSTLLDALAGRKTLDSGEVLLNGRRPGEDFKRLTGYCEQQDFLLGTLTVRETVRFSAELRLPPTFALQATPGERRGEIEARVAAVVKELGLEACADTMVGTQFVRGISGGEKKRTNLARELVTDPAIVFMDEPTTGLDSQTAGTVVGILAGLATRQHKTVVLSIHQPKYSIFKLFHSLILLHEGKMAYMGRAAEAEAYFERLGFEREVSNNPADWFVDVLTLSTGLGEKEDGKEGGREEGVAFSLPGRELVEAQVVTLAVESEGEESKQLVLDMDVEGGADLPMTESRLGGGKPGAEPPSPPSSSASSSSASSTPPSSSPHECLTEIYLQSPEYKALMLELAQLKGNASSLPPSPAPSRGPYATTLLHQIKVLSHRTMLCAWRNPASAMMQFSAMLFFVALIGGIYWKMDLGPQGLQNRIGAFFILIMMCMFSNISALELFIEERAVFVHEKANGCYRPAAYFWAKSLCDIVPLRVIPAVFFCASVYPMMGLRSGFDHWLLFTATVILSMLAAAALCLMVSSWVPIFAVANLGVALIFILFLITGGVLINFEQLPAWLLPFKYVSIFRYAMEVMSVNELTGLKFECPPGVDGEVPTGCLGGSGDVYLALQHYPRFADLWKNLLAIAGIFVACMALTFLSLRRIRVR